MTTTNPAHLFLSPDIVAAYAVSVRWHEEDFSNQTHAFHSAHTPLSTSAKAGIGLGVTYGVLIVIISALTIYHLYRQLLQPVAARYTPVESFTDEEMVKGSLPEREISGTRSVWGIIGPDSWLYESIAVCLSIACLAAIVCILLTFDGQLSPNLPSGIQLNTVVSVLATVSKSSLVFAVGECIGQLQWISLRQSQWPLSCIQLYNSASRGPWGSALILLRDRGHSLVTVGAFIVVLALAFDPFVQQIISYPVEPTPEISATSQVAQSRFFLSREWSTTEITYAVESALWTDSSSLNLRCPTGNCTWPRYRSVEMCSRCADVDSSRVVLSGWDISSFNVADYSHQTIPSTISMLNGTPFDVSIQIPSRKPGKFQLPVPQYLYWVSNIQEQNLAISDDGTETLVRTTATGVANPLIVVAYAELHLPRIFSTSRSNLSIPFSVIKATECALSICTREYNLSVANGAQSVEVLDKDFGSFYIKGQVSAVCWRPSSSPMTNWSKAGQSEWSGMTDPINFEFCGVDAKYINSTLPLFGTITKGYSVAGAFNDGSINWDDEQPPGFEHSGTASSSFIMRTNDLGLETVVDRIASSLSNLARTKASSPIYGVFITQKTYVAVQWLWLILPAVLLLVGTVLLGATVLVTSHNGASLWKSSVLPLLFHGLELNLFTRDMVVERGPCEMASEMEQMAGELNANKNKISRAYDAVNQIQELTLYPRIELGPPTRGLFMGSETASEKPGLINPPLSKTLSALSLTRQIKPHPIMFNLITRVRTLLGDQSSLTHSMSKVAILGLPDAGKRAFLQHLSDIPLSPITVTGCHAGWTSSSPSRELSFIAADVGLSARLGWRAALAARYADADALIIVVNSAHAIALEELRYQLGCLVHGRMESGEMQTYCIARKGIPWLVLVNFKGGAVDVGIAKEQVDCLGLDGLGVDWLAGISSHLDGDSGRG
ncbi:DUF3176 domain-containing protein [Aspergillus brunneoviolaceus CBS 621.78]|uniref:Uncharacterized protein n=1 Tax=Aspergillus brunneoviolaceus CBS 621.78 TaxID=1450534 RepID=A0ACD1GGM0_9EURO|nr:hypothetical protein BO95DRAFT_491086 [Aspergillus brunneoviolaceus CBS 621.78]RAH48310.1 hypothetical protein BO95DRAFT_491086 [Aspergillus brunneoviolaceus CBS 621.78]